MSCCNSIFFLLFLALLPCGAKIRSRIHHSLRLQPRDSIKAAHNMLPVYIKQNTEATPLRQYPVTFMNKNLIHLPLCTLVKADKSPVEGYYQAVLTALTLSRPVGTSSFFAKLVIQVLLGVVFPFFSPSFCLFIMVLYKHISLN